MRLYTVSSGKKQKKYIISYRCLTLLKSDVKDFVKFFQNNLQDVQIALDDVAITDPQQLDRLSVEHQATTFFACGYYSSPEGGTHAFPERQRVTLKLDKKSAYLTAEPGDPEKSAREPTILLPLQAILKRCQDKTQSFWMTCTYATFIGPAMGSGALNHHQNVFMWIAQLITALLMIPVAYYVFYLVTKHFHFDRFVFLLPGAEKSTDRYGGREVLGSLWVAVVIMFILQFILTIPFRG